MKNKPPSFVKIKLKGPSNRKLQRIFRELMEQIAFNDSKT